MERYRRFALDKEVADFLADFDFDVLLKEVLMKKENCRKKTKDFAQLIHYCTELTETLKVATRLTK